MSFSEPKPENDRETRSHADRHVWAAARCRTFNTWRKRYPAALVWLDPQRISALATRRKRMQRIIILTATTAAAICAVAWHRCSTLHNQRSWQYGICPDCGANPEGQTITWKTVFYEHITSRDEKNTWFHSGLIEYAYKAPGLLREVRLDEKGQVESVQVSDWIRGRQMIYYPKQKKATLKEITPNINPSGPFTDSLKKLNAPNLQCVGKRKTATGEVNVFRHTYQWFVGHERNWSDDLWIDAKTKQLVATYNPGADVYDPENDPVHHNPPGNASGRTMMGDGQIDIAYNVELDDSLFSLKPPEGYAVEVKKRDRITEKEMIDYWVLSPT